MNHELHHVQRRETSTIPAKPIPDNSLVIKLLDRLAYPIALIGPISSLDQVIQIWKAQSADGVSLVVWFTFLITSIFWIFYATIHRAGAIFFSHLLWIILSGIILFEIIIFS